MKKKTCNSCLKTKIVDNFYKDSKCKDGYEKECKICRRARTKRNRILNMEYYINYRRYNFGSIFIHRYSCMKSRSRYVNSRIIGMPMCSKEEFFAWCRTIENMKSFYKIWCQWQDSGFQKRFSPSIDRINNNESYMIDNIQWLPQWQNSTKGNKTQYEISK